MTDVLDNHLTGYWGNCDSLENELAQVLFMSLIYKTTKFNLLLSVYLVFIRILEDFCFNLLFLARKDKQQNKQEFSNHFV